MNCKFLQATFSCRLLLIIILIGLSKTTFAFSYAVVGTASSTSNLSGPTTSSGTGATNNNQRSTAIYTVAELNAAGINAGNTLLGIAWNKTGAGSYLTSNLTINIYLKHSSTTTFSANPTFATEVSSPAILVYTSTTASIPEALGYFNLSFNQSAFTWNGSDNIQVITEFIRTTAWDNTSFNWTTLASVTNSSATSSTAVATLSRTGTRPLVRFEVATSGADAALLNMPSPVGPIPGAQNIEITVRNTGDVTLNAVALQYTLNAGAPVASPASVSLAPGESTLINLGSVSFALGQYIINTNITGVNGGSDNDPTNNAFNKTVMFCNPLSGGITINKMAVASLTNYTSFNALATALSTCGISADVNVSVLNGPYNEQVVFKNISGLGAGAKITIEGNGQTIISDTAIIQLGANPNRHIIKLTGLSYFTINNLHVNMLAGSTGFIGIHVLNSGNDINITNCSFDIGTATSTLLGGLVFNGVETGLLSPGGSFNNINVKHNTFTGGGYGVSVVGLAPPLATNVVVDSNFFYSFSDNAIYLRETDGVIISNNKFDKSGGTTSIANGVQLAQTNNVNGNILNNYFKVSQSNGSLRAIYLFNGTGHKVYNNVISDISSTAGDIIGIQLRTASTAPQVYNNTISIDGGNTTGNVYGIRIENVNTGAVLRNNVISLTTNAATKAAIYLPANTNTATTISSNNNIFNVPGGSVAAYTNSTTFTNLATTLSNWQGAPHNQDAASVEGDPLFESLILPRPTAPAFDNLGVTYNALANDITGAVRNASTPDIGAYEFTGALPVTLVSFTGDRANKINKLKWQTATEANNTGFELQRSNDGINFTKLLFINSKAANGNSNVVINYGIDDIKPLQGSNYYRLKQIDKNGKSALSNIVALKGDKVNSIMLSNIYPNPAKNVLNVILTAPQQANVDIVITDLAGKIILKQNNILTEGDNNIKLNTAALASGTYLLKALCNNGCETLTTKFIKQ